MEPETIDELIYTIISSRMQRGQSFNSVVDISTVYDLLEAAQEVLGQDPILLRLPADIVVVGDIHGNIDDLLRIFEGCGYPPKTKYLFLGDYIDRGNFGLEVISLLFCLKIKYPEHVYLIRGNHEIERISTAYGFYDELAVKYTIRLHSEVHNTFNNLPLAAVIAHKYFCVHGGIGPSNGKLEDLEKMDKPEDISASDVFSDMLWSDPRDIPVSFQSSKRGSGYYFNENALDCFLEMNNLRGLIRSHELCMKGKILNFKNNKCITIFSNTNYCERSNSASVLKITRALELRFINFSNLTRSEQKMRRIILPKWLLESQLQKDIQTTELYHPPSPLSPLSEPSSEADEFAASSISLISCL